MTGFCDECGGQVCHCDKVNSVGAGMTELESRMQELEKRVGMSESNMMLLVVSIALLTFVIGYMTGVYL